MNVGKKKKNMNSYPGYETAIILMQLQYVTCIINPFSVITQS